MRQLIALYHIIVCSFAFYLFLDDVIGIFKNNMSIGIDFFSVSILIILIGIVFIGLLILFDKKSNKKLFIYKIIFVFNLLQIISFSLFDYEYKFHFGIRIFLKYDISAKELSDGFSYFYSEVLISHTENSSFSYVSVSFVPLLFLILTTLVIGRIKNINRNELLIQNVNFPSKN